MKISNGRSLQPLSGRTPRHIVLLLHGYGSDGADLISFAPHWQAALPDALFLAPNAPQQCAMGYGYQWWGLTSFSPDAMASGAVSAAPAIEAFIDRKLHQYGLTEAELVLVGFSQGTMMALHVGLRRTRAVAAIIGYSGMLTGAADLAHATITKPPVLLVHGSADPVVPFASLDQARRALEGLGIAVTTHVSNGLGHSIDEKGLRLGGEFAAAALA